jgi:hypothetical protein
MTISPPTSRPVKQNGSPQKGGRPSGQRRPLNCGTLDQPSSGATRSRKAQPPCQQLGNNRIDSAVVAFLLLLGNHLLLWIILLGGALLLPQVLLMRDAAQILQHQRLVAPVAPVLRND